MGTSFVEALEFLKFMSAPYNAAYSETPKLQLYDAEKEGFSIWIKVEPDNKEFFIALKQAADMYGLQMRQVQKFVVVQSL